MIAAVGTRATIATRGYQPAYHAGDSCPDSGRTIDTTTRSAAQLLSGHTPVIWLDHIRGCYLLDRVTPRATSRAAINVARRDLLAVLKAAKATRALTVAELETWSTLSAWWQRHRHSRKSRLPSLIDAAMHRVTVAERHVAEGGGYHARTSLLKAKARLDRYVRENEEIARG